MIMLAPSLSIVPRWNSKTVQLFESSCLTCIAAPTTSRSVLNELLIAQKSGDDAEVQLKLAFAYVALKDPANCIVCLEKAAKLKPDNPDVENALISVWRDVVKLNPGSATNHIGLVRHLNIIRTTLVRRLNIKLQLLCLRKNKMLLPQNISKI